MQESDERAARLLAAVYEATGGDPSQTAGMWDAGEKIGLDRARTEETAMGLVGDGLLEIKSLSGGLALTEEGLRAAGAGGPATGGGEAFGLADFAAATTAVLSELDLSPETRRDMEVDLEALNLLARRSQPLPDVERALLEAVRRALKTAGDPRAEQLITRLNVLQ